MAYQTSNIVFHSVIHVQCMATRCFFVVSQQNADEALSKLNSAAQHLKLFPKIKLKHCMGKDITKICIHMLLELGGGGGKRSSRTFLALCL